MTVQLLKTQSQIRPTIAFVWNWKGIVPQFTFSLYFWMLCIFSPSSLYCNTKNQTDMHFYMTMTRKSFCFCFIINPKEFSIFISLLVSHIFSKNEMTMKVSLSTFFDFFNRKKLSISNTCDNVLFLISDGVFSDRFSSVIWHH